MTTDRPELGTPIVFQWRKWDGGAHWRHECVYLGSDQWGDWLGQHAGAMSSRPGRDVVAATSNVTLVPASGDYASTVNRHPASGVWIYVDLGWDIRWENPTLLTGIDMDLDVVRVADERGTWVDDRDEWDDHRVLYGYPEPIQHHIETLTLALEVEVRAEVAPFDEATGEAWLARLESLPES